MIIILHLDLDAFYASVEEREHPEYCGKPVVVGADPKGGTGRGVVSTCNYEARKYGIQSGMPISIAYRKCPDCIFLPVNMELYVKASERIMQILRKYADKFEQVSIDEAYLDVSRLKNYEKAKELAMQIKKEIREKENLTCSIGIGPNKLIAKVASDYKKPDGLTMVKTEEALDFLSPQSVRVLRGIGPKTELVLNKYGIKTVKDLRKISKDQLILLFGKFGESIYHQARAEYETELTEEWVTKSIGRNNTFEQDTKDQKTILQALDEMAEDIWKQLKAEKAAFKTVTIRIRYEDFETRTKQKTLIDYSTSLGAIKNTARDLIFPFLKDNRKIRLVGVSVHQLK
jgi:DNA polymerase IV (DinB-like DNA polymerase)